MVMTEAPQNPHPDELRSDLDLLIEMVNDAKHDGEVIHRHFESLTEKLHSFIHQHGGGH
jgi:hypothetical protein